MNRLPLFIASVLLVVETGCSTHGVGKQEKHLSAQVPNADTLSYVQQQGRTLFGVYCVVCHGIGGRGDGFNAYNLDPRPRDLADSTYFAHYSSERLAVAITQGGRGVNKSVAMPAWGYTLQTYQVDYLLEYLKVLRSNSN